MAAQGLENLTEQAMIPIYRIDLSLPASKRYEQVARDFAPSMQALTPLFDEVLATVIPSRRVRRLVEFFASLLLLGVFATDETREIRGIAKVAGVDVYLLVALNVLLDSLLGCTSGAVLTSVKGDGGPGVVQKGERLMHFRTLDWGMDGLRSLLVVLEYFRSDSRDPERVIARSVSYAGFVGVLTGVRQDLSVSLNFRPNHHCSSLSLRWHQLMVIFGWRPSISSVLRSVLLATATSPTSLHLAKDMAKTRSAPCYLVLSDGKQSTVIEKDLNDGILRSTKDFIVHTNHDVASAASNSSEENTSILGLEAFVEDSQDRQKCITKKWERWIKREEKKGEGRSRAVKEETLISWVKAYPTMNECSHFACLMDPESGTIRWLERGVLGEDAVEGGEKVAAREAVLHDVEASQRLGEIDEIAAE